ncbi:MAG: hypothetical protein R3F20_01105 [Planctomycetota bacterium]
MSSRKRCRKGAAPPLQDGEGVLRVDDLHDPEAVPHDAVEQRHDHEEHEIQGAETAARVAHEVEDRAPSRRWSPPAATLAL